MTKRDSIAVGPRLHTQQGQLMLSLPLDEALIIASAKRIVKQRVKRLTRPLDKPDKIADYLTVTLASEEREQFLCLFLDQHHRLITVETLFQGTVNSSEIHPREVVKAALKINATTVVVAHNHPSGNLQPSPSDLLITQKLAAALALVGVVLLDHFIVAGSQVLSFREKGLM